MDRRILWPAVGVVAVVALWWATPSTPAQPGGPWGRFQPTGRFVVAHASATQVLILDTTTGTIFKAGEKDFKAFADLAKMMEEGGGGPPPFPKDGGFGGKDGPFGKDKGGFGKDGKKEGKKRPPAEKDD